VPRCKSCGADRPPESFIRSGKSSVVCNICAEKAAVRYRANIERKIAENGRQCALCERIKPADAFDGDRRSCKRCLMYRRLADAQRKGGTVIDGVVHRRCPKCKQTKPRDEFSAGEVFVANCRDCRQKTTLGLTKVLSGKLDWGALKFPDCPGPWSAAVLGCDCPVETGRAS